MALDYQVYAGQYIKIYINEELQMAGMASPTKLSKIGKDLVYQSIGVTSLNTIAARRTIKIAYPAGTTWGEIANDMLDVLVQDGIEEGTIQTGGTIGEAWADDCISVADVFDELMSISGYQCFVDYDWKLHFYEEKSPIPNAPYDIVEGGAFDDFMNVEIDQDTVGYTNKVFIVGGSDTQGNQLFSIKGLLSYQNAMQEICGGTGIYGQVHKDTAITDVDMRWTGAGTGETSVFLSSAHNLEIGDMFWNKSLNKYSFVTDTPTTSSFTCESVTGQTDSQAIHFFPSSYNLARNLLRAQAVRPRKLTFDTFNLEFEVQSNLKARLPSLGLPVDSYFNIEEITIKGIAPNIFRSTITASLKNNDLFSTKRSENYVDYFRRF